MKRIILILLCLFCFQTKVAAKEVTVEKIETGFSSTKTNASSMTFTAPLYQLFVEGRIAYCIEPGVSLKEQTYQSSTDFNDIGVSTDTRREMELIAYYGYQYQGHESIEYYMATQELLWEKMGATGISFADQYGNPIEVNSYKEDILYRMSQHHAFPSFAFKEYKVKVGETLTLRDENYALPNYQLKGKEGTIDGDFFITKQDTEEEKQYLFESKRNYDTSFVYVSTNSQKVAVFELSDTDISAFSIKVKSELDRGKIVLTKIDTDSNTLLENAEFGLYDLENNLITKGITGKDGILTFEKIPYGKYYLKELKAPKGYLKNEEVIFVEINEKENKVQIANKKYEMPITGNIDRNYYKASLTFLLVGAGLLYAYKKAY
ncbi:MAG: SpaA isopeptide-forming pilin-related protein [Bacilli bacterium]|nr:SpaA isopeptide-forming pilin-related protein [Bacilli bacterium]